MIGNDDDSFNDLENKSVEFNGDLSKKSFVIF
jgi:hypothetical protein